MLIAIALTMFILIVASTWWFGLWSNLITLINLLIAAMVASSIYEPIYVKIRILNGTSPKNSEYFEFLSVWIAFVATYVILRAVTDLISGYQMKFDPITEIVGRTILSVWIACAFICFSFFTLQMAPLPPGLYDSGFGFEKQSAGTIPDRAWLAFIQSRSRGALSASKAKGIFPEYIIPPHRDDVDLDARVYDPNADFLDRHASKRSSVLMKAIEAARVRDNEWNN